MKRTFLLIGSLLIASGISVKAQQIPNGSFDDFKDAWSYGKDPTGWNGSNVNQLGVTVDEVFQETPGRLEQGSAVKLVNTCAGMTIGFPSLSKWFGSNAPAYITLGSPWVYASTTNGDGGTWGGVSFKYKPDAIRGYIKREVTDKAHDHGESNVTEICNIIYYSWKGHTVTKISNVTSSADKKSGNNVEVNDLDRAVLGMSTPESISEDFALIATGQYNVPATTTTDWQEINIPIHYSSDEEPEMMNIIISAADYFNRAKIGDNNKLWADDFEFVYYSDLKSLSYDGTPINIEDTKNIQIAAKDFDLSKVSCTSGKGADIQKKYDPSTHTLTITIYGNDYSVNNNNKNTYSVKIVPSISEVESTYSRWVTVTLSTEEPSSIIGNESLNDIEISGDENGKAVFSLTGFTFPGFGDMGTVVIKDGNLNYEADGSISIEATNPAVPIEGLGGMPVPVVLKGNLKDGKLTADVQIDLMETFEMNVSVHVDDVPFKTSGANGILTVTGNIASAYGAAYVKGDSKANIIDLTGATLATGLNSSNFSTEANNTLYKISEDQILDGNNVIQNGTCENLVLTDGLTFNAPEDFEATNVTFNRKFTTGNLSTVVLPFSFDTADVNGTVYKLESVENGVLSFKSVEGTADANVPYLVKTAGDNLFKKSLTNATVAHTPETVENSIAGTGVTHEGNFGETMEITSDNQTSWYGYNKNGSFVKVLSGTVKPFRSAIKSTGAAPSSFALKLDGTVTGILNLENPNAKVDVYTVSGVCVRKNVPAASALNGLSRGVYIVGGQKVVK